MCLLDPRGLLYVSCRVLNYTGSRLLLTVGNFVDCIYDQLLRVVEQRQVSGSVQPACEGRILKKRM